MEGKGAGQNPMEEQQQVGRGLNEAVAPIMMMIMWLNIYLVQNRNSEKPYMLFTLLLFVLY